MNIKDNLVATYQHPDGEPRNVYRLDYPKDFEGDAPCSYVTNNKACGKIEKHKHIIGKGSPSGTYLLPWLPDNGKDVLVIVEGEPAASALVSHLTKTEIKGYIPVSWKGGSGVVHLIDYSLCKGRKVICWPDEDSEGRKAMSTASWLAHKSGATDVYGIKTEGETKRDAHDYSATEAIEILKKVVKVKLKDPGGKDESHQEVKQPDIEAIIVNSMDTLETIQDTMMGISEIFLAECAEEVLVAWSETHEASFYWLNDYGIWRKNNSEIEASLVEAATQWMKREINKIADRVDFSDKQKASMQEKITKRFQSITSSSAAIKRNLTLVTSLMGILKREGRVPENLMETPERLLDSDIHLLGAQNGIVDLSTGELLTGAQAASRLVTRQISINYVPWKGEDENDFSSSLFAVNINWPVEHYMWGILGKSLHGKVDRRFYVIQGKTRGGKTSIFNILQHILGDEYYGAVHPDAISKNKQGGGSAGLSPELAAFCEKRIVVMEEIEKMTVDTGRLKQATGDSQISYRRLHQDLVTGVATATLFMPLNRVPNLQSDDTAIQDRMRVVPIPPVPSEHIKLNWKDEMVANKKALEQIFGRLVANAVEFKDSYPTEPPLVVDATGEKVDEDKGRVGRWVEEALIESKDGKFSRSMLFDAAKRHFKVPKEERFIDDWDSSRLMNAAKEKYGLPPSKSMRINDQVQRGWSGWRIASEEVYIPEPDPGIWSSAFE